MDRYVTEQAEKLTAQYLQEISRLIGGLAGETTSTAMGEIGRAERAGEAYEVRGLASAPKPTAGEVSQLVDQVRDRLVVLHAEIDSVQARFDLVLGPGNDAKSAGPGSTAPVPTLSILGSRVFEALNGVEAAIARLKSLRQQTCL